MTFTHRIRSAAACLLLASCLNSCSGEDQEPVPAPRPEEPIPISLSCRMTGSYTTRATDTTFEQGDRVGLYVVNRHADGTPAPLKQTGNHVDNMGFTYQGSWTPDSPIYWLDETTRADFYLYYPYAASTTVEECPFSVAADQSTAKGYKASDFLWGKRSDVAPTAQAVDIGVAHLMSCARIRVKPGNGFTHESLAQSQVSVRLNGVRTACTISLADGSIAATGEAASISPLAEDDYWKALLPPQTVDERDDLLTVTVDGRDFRLKGGMTFRGGTRHTITATVNKTSNGINVNISPWEDDETDHGGVAE